MSARILDGKAIAASVRDALAAQARELSEQAGVQPTLAIMRAGDDPASESYARQIARTCERTGMAAQVQALDAQISTEAFLDVVDDLNHDRNVHGILLQEPYPETVDGGRLVAALDPRKDIDGVHPLNAGRLLHHEGEFFVPATARGGLELLQRSGIDILGRRAVIIGRSNIVGKPFALLLLHEHATVTVCHSRTRDLATVTREADILAAAVGRPGFVTADMVRPGAAVIDFGINFLEDRMVGDVDAEPVAEVAGFLTPVPGGTGPMTSAMLLSNLLEACRRQLQR